MFCNARLIISLSTENGTFFLFDKKQIIIYAYVNNQNDVCLLFNSVELFQLFTMEAILSFRAVVKIYFIKHKNCVALF